MPIPDKRSVIVDFRSRQAEGVQDTVMRGEWHKLQDGYVLTCDEPPTEDGGVTKLTLFVRAQELRLRRRGNVSMEQRFRAGDELTGTYDTPYGPLTARARTGELAVDVAEKGGAVEWDYELFMEQTSVGRFHIRLDIREELLS